MDRAMTANEKTKVEKKARVHDVIYFFIISMRIIFGNVFHK